MPRKEHWERIYSTRGRDAVSWYQEHAGHSLRLIEATGVDRTAPVIDVGGGRSTLVDDLRALQYRDITVLDISSTALHMAKRRLGHDAGAITWREADITTARLPRHAYALWHDRAVFHFLTAPEDRHAYVRQVVDSLQPGGHVIMATFARDGPSRCSGLPVMRYSARDLQAEFGKGFQLISHDRETHRTPFGTTQQFTYCYCRKSVPE